MIYKVTYSYVSGSDIKVGFKLVNGLNEEEARKWVKDHVFPEEILSAEIYKVGVGH